MTVVIVYSEYTIYSSTDGIVLPKGKSEKDIKESCFVNKTELIGLMAFLGDLYNKGLINTSLNVSITFSGK